MIAKKIMQKLLHRKGEETMILKETLQQLGCLLSDVARDLNKVHRGNKAAAQRVRVGTIRLEKLAKVFRKESVAAEKGGKWRKLKASFRKKKRKM